MMIGINFVGKHNALLNSFLLKWSPSKIAEQASVDDAIPIIKSLLNDSFRPYSYLSDKYLSSDLEIFYTSSTNGAKAISIAENDDFFVLLYGNVIASNGSEGMASYVLSRINVNDAFGQLHHLQGHYTLIVEDKKNKQLQLSSDCTGTLACYYFEKNKNFYIASHELWLLATGKISFEYDLTSFFSILCINWSIGGYSNFKEIHRFNGLKKYVISNQGIGASNSFPKVSELQESSIDISSLYVELSKLLKSQTNLKLELTAGGDTRSLFALLKGFGHDFKTVTVGADDYMDVCTAKYISNKYDIEHEQIKNDGNSLVSFLKSAEILALVTSGKSNAKRALLNAGFFNYKSHFDGAVIGGEQGGIYKGYFYPKGGQDWLSWGVSEISDFLLSRNMKFKNYANVFSQDIPLKYRERFNNTLGYYSEFATIPPDILDLYFSIDMSGNIYETAQLNWFRKYTLFTTELIVKQAMSMPWQDRKAYHFHRKVTMKYLPQLNGLPINGAYFVRSNKPREKTRLAVWKSKFMGLKKGHNPEYNRHELFMNHLESGLEDEMLQIDGDFANFMNLNLVRKIIDEHKQGKNHLEALCYIQTFRSYDNLVRKVATLLK